jgi:ubiquinone/menaquinone biosynthesis C-methylase UbiE
LPGILHHHLPGFAQLYDAYSLRVVPKLGKAVAQDEDSYRYLLNRSAAFRRWRKSGA